MYLDIYKYIICIVLVCVLVNEFGWYYIFIGIIDWFLFREGI